MSRQEQFKVRLVWADGRGNTQTYKAVVNADTVADAVDLAEERLYNAHGSRVDAVLEHDVEGEA